MLRYATRSKGCKILRRPPEVRRANLLITSRDDNAFLSLTRSVRFLSQAFFDLQQQAQPFRLFLDEKNFLLINVRFVKKMRDIDLSDIADVDKDSAKTTFLKQTYTELKHFLRQHRFKSKRQWMFVCRLQYKAWKEGLTGPIQTMKRRLNTIKNASSRDLLQLFDVISRIETPSYHVVIDPQPRGCSGVAPIA